MQSNISELEFLEKPLSAITSVATQVFISL